MYFKHLTFKYDENKLKKEFKQYQLNPFRISEKELSQDHSHFNDDYNPNSWFNVTDTWLYHRIRNFNNAPEINRIYQDLTLKLGFISTSIFKQLSGSEVPFHSDYGKVRCAVNIILSSNSAPIVFEDIGEVSYKCALINITKRHKVPSFSKERLLLKFNIFDVEYKDAEQILS